MYKNILVPLDGSQLAETILSHVEPIAKKFNATVCLLRVQTSSLMLERDEVVDFSKYHEEFEAMKTIAADYLETKKQNYRQQGIEVVTRLVFGPVVEKILEVAEEMHADLIAMASHGVGGSPKMFYGSATAGVLHRIDRPLLIIRAL